MGYEPILDWAFAAQWWGETWRSFTALDGDEQAFLVAVYRAHNRIEGVLNKDAARRVKT